MLPFTEKVEAEFVSRVDVGQVGRVGMECKSRLHDMDAGRLPMLVAYSRTVRFAADAGWIGTTQSS